MLSRGSKKSFWISFFYAVISAQICRAILEYIYDVYSTCLPYPNIKGEAHVEFLIHKASILFDFNNASLFFIIILFLLMYMLRWRRQENDCNRSAFFGAFQAIYFFILLNFGKSVEAGVESVYVYGYLINYNFYSLVFIYIFPALLWMAFELGMNKLVIKLRNYRQYKINYIVGIVIITVIGLSVRYFQLPESVAINNICGTYNSIGHKL